MAPTGATDTQTVTITILGANSDPVITVGAGDSSAESLTETDAGLTTDGTLSVEDLDQSDAVAATFALDSATGVTGGLTNTVLEGFFSLGANPVIDGTTTTGAIAWDFDSDTEAFDYLAVGEQLVLTYTVTATDTHLRQRLRM